MRLLDPSNALAREIQAREEALLQPDIRKSRELADALADEFIEFGASGRTYTKQDIVDTLLAERPVAQTTSHVRVFELGPDAALIVYMIRREGEPPVHTLRSSVWQRRAGTWRMAFHQGTVTTDPDAAA